MKFWLLMVAIPELTALGLAFAFEDEGKNDGERIGFTEQQEFLVVRLLLMGVETMMKHFTERAIVVIEAMRKKR